MFKTYEQLLVILESRGITIMDGDIELLEKNGYSFLLHNFGKVFLNKNGKYENATLKEIVFLSEIDSKISSYFWRKISKIEKLIKVSLIDTLGCKYGSEALLDRSIFRGDLKDQISANITIDKVIKNLLEKGWSDKESKFLWNIINATTMWELMTIIKTLPLKIVGEVLDKISFGSNPKNSKGYQKRHKSFIDSMVVIRKFRNMIGHQKPIIKGANSNREKKMGVFELFNAFEKFNDYKDIRERVFIHFDDEDNDSEKVHNILNQHFGLRFTREDLPDSISEKNSVSDSVKPKQRINEKKTQGDINV